MIEHGGAGEVNAMAATMLYRHLGRLQRIEAMTIITNLKNKRLVSRLRALAVDTTYVNPQWGIWSLTNEELLEDQAAHEQFNQFVGYLGATASILGAKDIIMEFKNKGRLTVGSWAVIAIAGIAFFNARELKKVNREIKFRSGPMKTSPFHQKYP
jgi:hypothetical protein